jgi:hypothetical protein
MTLRMPKFGNRRQQGGDTPRKKKVTPRYLQREYKG